MLRQKEPKRPKTLTPVWVVARCSLMQICAYSKVHVIKLLFFFSPLPLGKQNDQTQTFKIEDIKFAA
jgi:hypothetical protein